MNCPACGAHNADAAEMCFTCGRALFGLTQGTLVAGRYQILESLGKGGMGMVYKAHDRKLDEPVAIKILRPGFASDPDIEKRFLQEIKLARRVSHRNVCRIHEYGEEQGIRYISMALVEGSDLKRVVREDGPLAADAALDVAIQVAEGLQAIHDEGIVHRDLKPGNLIRDAKGVVRLLDFGIAKQVDAATADALTTTGMVVGTPDYLSPEQAMGQPAGARSDVYSLGVVLFELLTGRLPFHGDSAYSTLQKHVHEPPPLDGPEAARIPRAALPILRKALAKDPALRYASAHEMAEVLRRARETLASATATAAPGPASQVATTPFPRPPRPRGAEPPPAEAEPRQAHAGALSLWLPVLAFALLLVVWLRRGPGSEPPAASRPAPAAVAAGAGDAAEPTPEPTLREAAPTPLPRIAPPEPTPAPLASPSEAPRFEPTPEPAPDPVQELRDACDRSRSQACLDLGDRLRTGRGVARDMELAARAYERACDSGAMKGCGALGMLYLSGQGVARDTTKAGWLLKQACDGNEVAACRLLEQLKRRLGRSPGG